MRLFLIRHGETVAIVTRVLAGSTDTPLTNHGVEQIKRLGEHFDSHGIYFTHVFSSDLTRARLTAEGACRGPSGSSPPSPVLTADLRERDFGALEDTPWAATSESKSDPSADEQLPESDAAMNRRANAFLADRLLPLLLFDGQHETDVVAVVAHGVILRVLWACLVALFEPDAVHVPRLDDPFKPVWSNTGFLEVKIRQSPGQTQTTSRVLTHWTMDVVEMDSKAHLADLHRTRGGIGSAAFDKRQRRIDQFF
ncbi:hypothetical protein ASPZODRAFT_136392 [Penicilliopsis zonata CBS 506.65]|uniref:Phosphoglycerate mutase n=1 Tax=Penicilliopsis zonata CBS 506.65 TaxID=1073090 RepID=A0A1L9S7Q9_9EURO|nr:hypothetical protein ASPZODRAFT_136392 [Penicilliopsis zonata CBS 506.65]OJJ43198.1 hypothetical protein ASPZODRAFT_136392 [Penicilliopsis zonata CBS 506.65]